MNVEGNSKIGVVGAGAMGSGIAQIAAAHGHEVILYDTSQPAIERAYSAIESSLARSVGKKRITDADSRAARDRVKSAEGSLDAFAGCALVIEAVVEDLAVKRGLFASLENAVGDDAILATNTSSLSVTSIASVCRKPERFLGIHFFNPPVVMPLVEIIPGIATDASRLAEAQGIIESWGKTAVIASDTPGFIVNRIARPFYGEAIRIYEEGIADMATIDWAMREIGRFKMGPFELMDFIGNDINLAATKSVYEATFHDSRFRPTLTQQKLVDAGFLGRKTGRGYYDYRDGAAKPIATENRELGDLVFRRILSMLINQAADALYLRIASAHDIDRAMTLGVNYPKGLLAWADEIGIAETVKWLAALQEFYGEERYRPSPLLKTMAEDGFTFFNT